MKKIKVSPGIFWVEIPEVNLSILCGCPGDSVKHLIKKGLITSDGNVNGMYTETGPNAILLSDIPMQKELFSNMAEFPVLQMLYKQGMIIPNHPNNTGVKPLLIGCKSEIEAQRNYIYRGNYGLTTIEEMISAGIDEKLATDLMRIKLKFAFGVLKETNELIDAIVVEDSQVEIRNGVLIKRLALNCFEISFEDQKAEVDLNLLPSEEYESPYALNYHKIERAYFSVIHSGEGDGWDISQPCMASILTFQGKIYLIDAGPNILSTLVSLGIGVNEIEGIFHTHAHDDHFSGLAMLLRTDHRIKYYSSKLIRTSVMKKLAALTSIKESNFDHFFEFCDLEVDAWNNIEGLEVKPVYSPHPVETNIFFFRTLWGKSYKTYAHLADIAAFKVLENMVTDDSEKDGISADFLTKVKKCYLEPQDLKKIDIGGGMIHGCAEDFVNDQSEKILLSHTALPLTNRQKELGENTTFGIIDHLVPSEFDYSKDFIKKYIKAYLPSVPTYDINMLLNCPVVSFNPGSILIKRDSLNTSVFIVLSGISEFINFETGINNKMTVGAMIGELSGVLSIPVEGTYRAVSYVKTLEVPINLYIEILTKNGLLQNFIEMSQKRFFLQNSWLFGERISSALKSKIAYAMVLKAYHAGDCIPYRDEKGLFILKQGEVSILYNGFEIERTREGDFFGEAQMLYGVSDLFEFKSVQDSSIYFIPLNLLEDIPIVHWKLLEINKKRMVPSVVSTVFSSVPRT